MRTLPHQQLYLLHHIGLLVQFAVCRHHYADLFGLHQRMCIVPRRPGVSSISPGFHVQAIYNLPASDT